MDVKSAFDFDSLQSLKAQARREASSGLTAANGGAPDTSPAAQAGQKAALRKAAEQFEALFIQEMLKSMRASIEKDELTNNTTTETYEALFDREVSLQMAKRGSVGVADMLVSHLERQQSAAEVLNQRRLEAPGATRPLRLDEKTYGKGVADSRGLPLEGATTEGIALPVRPASLPINPNPFKALK
jgi:peptidoglycan hydrolase FlgJ